MRENKESNSYSNNPSCCFEPFISPNPITSYNPIQHYPTIDQTAFVSQFTSVIGDVTLRNNVYVAPNVTIRADEGTPFYIGSHTNIQDRVILHGLANKKISVEGRKFSIFIGNEVSIAHGALIHGPCYIADKVFVGFNAIVYTAIVGRGAFISYNAVVTNGVTIPANTFVPPGAVIDSQEKADALTLVPSDSNEFAIAVQQVNQELPASYHLLIGRNRCSCGMAYNHN